MKEVDIVPESGHGYYGHNHVSEVIYITPNLSSPV